MKPALSRAICISRFSAAMLAERISPAEEGTGVATKKHHQKLAKQNKYEALIGSLDVLKILPGIFFFF